MPDGARTLPHGSARDYEWLKQPRTSILSACFDDDLAARQRKAIATVSRPSYEIRRQAPYFMDLAPRFAGGTCARYPYQKPLASLVEEAGTFALCDCSVNLRLQQTIATWPNKPSSFPDESPRCLSLPRLALSSSLRQQRRRCRVEHRVLSYRLYPVLTSMPGSCVRTAATPPVSCRAFASVAHRCLCWPCAGDSRRSSSSIRGLNSATGNKASQTGVVPCRRGRHRNPRSRISQMAY